MGVELSPKPPRGPHYRSPFGISEPLLFLCKTVHSASSNGGGTKPQTRAGTRLPVTIWHLRTIAFHMQNRTFCFLMGVELSPKPPRGPDYRSEPLLFLCKTIHFASSNEGGTKPQTPAGTKLPDAIWHLRTIAFLIKPYILLLLMGVELSPKPPRGPDYRLPFGISEPLLFLCKTIHFAFLMGMELSHKPPRGPDYRSSFGISEPLLFLLDIDCFVFVSNERLGSS
jgi:hypothetical protein